MSYIRRYNKVYPEHGLGERGRRLSTRAIRGIAEELGASPEWAKQYAQVTRGESGGRPGIRGDDPGGTKGWGLSQITPGVQGQEFWNFMRKNGWTERDLRNPVVNTKVAMWMDKNAGGSPRKGGGSWSNWYGTRFLDRNVGDVNSVLKGGRRGRASRREPGSLELTRETIPGVDMSAQRDALMQQTMMGSLLEGRMPSQEELLQMQTGINALDDVPEEVRLGLQHVPGKRVGGQGGRGKGGRIITGTGRSVQRMLQMAEKWDKAKVPYLWGGGHGRIAKPGEQVDCSGFVSAVLGLDTPQVSGNLAKWGKPGKGKWVSVYANDGHVLMSIRDPRSKKVRWFGTSSSNPGGGAGEISKPSASYLSQFTVRHPG